MKAKSNNRGGRRPGSGNPGTPRVDEPRKVVSISLHPSVLHPFKKKHGRNWGKRVEEAMKEDLKDG